MRVKCSVYRFLLHTHIEGSKNITVLCYYKSQGLAESNNSESLK